jgi:hypothetical protein
MVVFKITPLYNSFIGKICIRIEEFIIFIHGIGVNNSLHKWRKSYAGLF